MSYGFASNLRDALPNASFIGLTLSLSPLGRASPDAPHCLCCSAPAPSSHRHAHRKDGREHPFPGSRTWMDHRHRSGSAFDTRSRDPGVTRNEPDAKAMLPEPRSVPSPPPMKWMIRLLLCLLAAPLFARSSYPPTFKDALVETCRTIGSTELKLWIFGEPDRGKCGMTSRAKRIVAQRR